MKKCLPNTCSIPEKIVDPDWRLDTLRPLLKKFQQNLIPPAQEKARPEQQPLERAGWEDKGSDNSL